MSDTKLEEANRLLSKAKIMLFSKKGSIFISNILFSLKHSWDDSVKTQKTNGSYHKINPEWFLNLSADQRCTAVAHIAWHVAFDHISRLGDRDPKKFAKAADTVIDTMLQNHGYDMLDDSEVDHAFRDKATEEVYRLLEDQEEEDDNKSSNGDEPYDGDIDFNEDQKDDINDKVLQARTAAAMGEQAGNLPEEIERAVDAFLNPVLPWQTLLDQYVSEYVKEEYSNTRPNRRYFPEFYLPTLRSLSMEKLAFAVDSSGSVSDAEFTLFIGEIESAMETLNPKLTTIVDFDCRIKKVHEINQGETTEGLEFQGRGGTNLQPVFDYYNRNPPTVLIIFSDLYCNKIMEDPGYPVIWVVINHPEAEVNFGDMIHYSTEHLND